VRGGDGGAARHLPAEEPCPQGKIHEAILEGVSSESELLLEGRLKRQAPEIDGKLLVNDVPEGFVPRPGAIVKVRVTGAHDYDLVGRVVA